MAKTGAVHEEERDIAEGLRARVSNSFFCVCMGSYIKVRGGMLILHTVLSWHINRGRPSLCMCLGGQVEAGWYIMLHNHITEALQHKQKSL